MPNIGLSDISPSDVWVTDSAAGMTAIVTGQKTKNGVISESSDTVRGVKDGAPLKTVLEYAEERGLSTGVISNMPMADATPAAVAKGRAVALSDEVYDPLPVVWRAIQTLSLNPKGYFLMVEWDMHTDKVKNGLEHALTMDKLIRQTVEQVGAKGKNDTLVLFSADHSFDLRLVGGKRGEQLSTDITSEKSALRMTPDHTGEEVVVAAQGPGAGRVHGYMPNTEIFHIMMDAFGWKAFQ